MACTSGSSPAQVSTLRAAASGSVVTDIGPAPTGASPSATSAVTSPPMTAARAPGVSPLVDVDPSITVDLRYATANNFTGAPLPGYGANRALLRPAAAAALARAESALRARGVTLVVLDAYRPVRATEAMVAWARRVGRADLPRRDTPSPRPPQPGS